MQHDRWVLLVWTWASWKKNQKITNFTIYQARTASWVDHLWHRCGVYWIFVTPCWWFCKRIVSTHYTAGDVKFRWIWQQRKGKGDCRQRMSYDVDFVQAETQLFTGGPCRFGVNQSTMSRLYSCWTKILEACINELPFGRTRLRFRKVCQLLSRTSILTHVSSSILPRLRLTALTTRYSVSDVVRLHASNFQELHHLSIHKCIARRLVKVCTFLTTLILPFVDLPPKKNKWIFSCITSRFSVLPVCLPPLYYFFFLIFFFQICTFDDSTTVSSFVWCHWTPATMHRPYGFALEL